MLLSVLHHATRRTSLHMFTTGQMQAWNQQPSEHIRCIVLIALTVAAHASACCGCAYLTLGEDACLVNE
jgi:hypothetical protein